MVLALAGPHAKAVRTLQWFSSAETWDDEVLLHRHWPEVDTVLGEDDGVLTLGGSDLLQQGQASVGVKRPYCGEVGKRAHCPAGVAQGDTSRQGDTLLERRLYWPQEWGKDEADAERRRRCGVPTAVTFKTKPLLGWEMIQAVHRAGTRRARWVACDEAFGRAPTLLDHIASRGLWDCAEVPHDTQGWQQRPATAVPAWGGRGRQPTRARVVAGAPAPQTVVMVAESLPAESWARHRRKEGSKGPMVAEGGGPARHRHAGGLARSRGLAGPAAQPGDWRAEDPLV